MSPEGEAIQARRAGRQFDTRAALERNSQPVPLNGEQAREAMAKRFTFQDMRGMPPGVSPVQLDFLREAAIAGAFQRVKPKTAEMIIEYFTTEKTYDDLAKEDGVHFTAVRERIIRGVAKMQRVLYKSNPNLAQEDKYPLGQIKKGKEKTEVFRTARSQQRRSEAHKRKPVQTTDIFVANPHS